MPKIPKKIKTVIIADDHAIVRDGLRLILEARDDITVVADVADGREAVRRAIELRPDVVVMDISMPGLNGIEATRQIREQRKHTQVVILSMHATSEHIYQALHAGAIAYLLKDSVGREVGEAVLAAARGERYLSNRITETMLDDYVRLRTLPDEASPLSRLSAREREVLQLVVEGMTSVEIASAIHLSPKTVDTYRSRLMQKLEIHDIPGLVRFAISHGISPSD
jgi:DNA-binding NarL/FixJ family response regulator